MGLFGPDVCGAKFTRPRTGCLEEQVGQYEPVPSCDSEECGPNLLAAVQPGRVSRGQGVLIQVDDAHVDGTFVQANVLQRTGHRGLVKMCEKQQSPTRHVLEWRQNESMHIYRPSIHH